MLGRTRSRTARLAAIGAALTLTAASAALAAPGVSDQGGTPSDGATQQLDAQTHQALLGLYALDSQLEAWRSRVASLGAAAAALRERRASLRHELAAAQTSFQTGQRRLAVALRALYERGSVDPVAVVLGADSLTKALRQLDALARVEDQSRQIVDATITARRRLLLSQGRLAAEQRRLDRSLAAARQAERNVAAAAASRLAYVSSLRARERAAQVERVVSAAHAAQQKSQQLQPPTPTATATPTPAPPPASGRQLVVSATCYDLPGRTATGMPVGRGVVAVDPSVIPLGTRMHIPGYGDGVAADVGSGIRGRIIDLWFPTYADCASWGRRTVTITIY